jgi:phenylpropionate dioxygenase-like ring-hydroxylating dioxygenase large terminal subunit
VSIGKPDFKPGEELTEVDIESGLVRAWWPIAIASDVVAPTAITLLGRDLVAFRGKDNEVFVADDACPHRGARLSTGRTLEGGALECPYHGWQWDGPSGRCTRIPALHERAAIPPAACLKMYPSLQYLGLVWTCLSEQPLTGFPSPTAPQLHGYDIRAASIEYETHVLAAIENFRDAAHVFFVHPDTIAPDNPVVEPLHPARLGWEVTLSREITSTEDGDFYYTGTVTTHYLSFVPHIGSVRYEPADNQGESWVFSCVCPMSLERTRVFIVVATAPDFQGSAGDMLAKEQVIFGQDKVVLDTLLPRRLGPESRQLGTEADRYTYLYRRTFYDFVAAAASEAEEDETAITGTV